MPRNVQNRNPEQPQHYLYPNRSDSEKLAHRLFGVGFAPVLFFRTISSHGWLLLSAPWMGSKRVRKNSTGAEPAPRSC